MTQHDDFSPSGAKRWMRCPGSVAFCRGAASTTNEQAELGTAAHALLEQCLKTGRSPAAFAKHTFNDRPTDSYIDAVDKAVEYIRRWGVTRTETRVTTPYMRGGGGTLDASYHGDGALHVFDYKNGRKRVSPVENEQLMIYALGELNDLDDVQYVHLHIVQPNAIHEVGECWSTTPAALHKWGKTKLLPIVDEIRAGTTRLHASPEGCDWCPKRGVCPAAAKHALAGARVDYEDALVGKPPNPTTPHGAKELAALLPLLPLIKSWAQAVELEVMRLLAKGTKVGTAKLVCPRPSRVWSDPARTYKALTKLRIDEDAFAPRELLGLGAVGRLLPAKTRDAFLAGHTKLRVSDRPVLAAKDDPRPLFKGDPTIDFEDDLHQEGDRQ